MGKKRVLVVGMLFAVLLAYSASALPVVWRISERYAEDVSCLFPCWTNSKWYTLGSTYDVHNVTKETGHITGRSCDRAETIGFDAGIAMYADNTSVDSWLVQGGCKKCWVTSRHDFQGQQANRFRVCGGNGDCHQAVYPFTFNYHQYDLVSTLDRTVAEQVIGTVPEFFGSNFSSLRNETGWSIAVSTDNANVMLWIGSSDNTTQKSTQDTNAEVWACADTDRNKQCDADQATTCVSNGGDWYKGACCPTTTTCTYNAQVKAFCGKNAAGNGEWVPLDEPGEIHELAGCTGSGMIVSNGTTLLQCGGTLLPTMIALSTFANVSISRLKHEYACQGTTITECGGSGAFSRTHSLPTGDVETFGTSSLFYCASDGDWTTDLDTKDRESCEQANFHWTGSRCCSEHDDQDEFYNDPLRTTPALGGCWNKTFVESGRFAVPNNVINYRGTFFGCRLNTTLLLVRDSHTGGTLINNSISTCGEFLPHAAPGSPMPHVFCNAQGSWEFTDELKGTIQKSIKWSALINMSGIAQSGCCGFDQCWNGTRCQPVETLYRIGDNGFVCTLPTA